jgi:hypothetical protein
MQQMQKNPAEERISPLFFSSASVIPITHHIRNSIHHIHPLLCRAQISSANAAVYRIISDPMPHPARQKKTETAARISFARLDGPTGSRP